MNISPEFQQYRDKLYPVNMLDTIRRAEAILDGFHPIFEIKPYWLIHHSELLEWNTEPIENRIAFIHAKKPANERETRLRWMRPVLHPEKLPPDVVTAGNLLTKLYIFRDTQPPSSYYTTSEIISTFHMLWSSIRYDTEAIKKIEDLHREECPGCPFDYPLGSLRFPDPQEGIFHALIAPVNLPSPVSS
jgi:hypothetical protein